MNRISTKTVVRSLCWQVIMLVAVSGCAHDSSLDDVAVHDPDSKTTASRGSNGDSPNSGGDDTGSKPSGAPSQPGNDGNANSVALLVGCTTYDHLPKERHLLGPANDVALLRTLLVERFQFPLEGITVLTEGQGDRPTRKNIEGEFRRLAKNARPGQRIVIVLAGHGSWQPNDPNDTTDIEPDGHDQVFCPADVTRLTADDQGKITNGIVDDDLRVWLEAILDRGAFVWLIADACHSGTLARGDDVARGIAPDELLPQSLRSKSAGRGAGTRGTESRGTAAKTTTFDSPKRGKDRFVALYAAQPAEETYEATLPPENPDGKRHGILTYAICEVLTGCETPITYRELVQRIHARYVRSDRYAYAPTPLLEGNLIDQEVLGEKVLPGRSRVVLSQDKDGRWKVNAGSLHDLTEGTVLAVYPAAGKKTQGDKPLGHVRVKELRALDAAVEPCAHDGLPSLQSFPEENRCEIAFFDYGLRQLRLAIDEIDESGKPIPAERLQALRQSIGALGKGTGRLVKPVTDLRRADWLVKVRGDKLFLVSQSQALGKAGASPPAFGPIPEVDLTDWLEPRLMRIARATNLVRVAATPLDETAGTRRTVQIEVQMLRFASAKDTKGTPVVWNRDGLRLRTGDVIAFHVKNIGRVSADVSLLSIDSAFGISQFFPEPGTAGNRLKPGDEFTTAPGRVDDKTVGVEHVVVIAAKANPQTSPLEFTFLEQPRGEQASRGAREDRSPGGGEWEFPLAQFLIDARSGMQGTRGFSRVKLDEHALQLITWRTVQR